MIELKHTITRKVDTGNDTVSDTTHRTSSLPISIRLFKSSDTPFLCSWVTSPKALSNISGNTGDCLTPNILEEWCSTSIVQLVLQRHEEPVAFCTLSTCEYELSDGLVELCHTITAPAQRRKYYATTLLHYSRLVAAQLDFAKIMGRIVRDNIPALRFAKYVRWSEDSDMTNLLDTSFKWFSYELRK